MEARRPRLAFGTGGLSGPAIRPVAVRMAWQAARAVKIPVIGIGGIATAMDVAEFLMAGATCVQVGTQTFVTPTTAATLADQLGPFLEKLGARSSQELVGTLKI